MFSHYGHLKILTQDITIKNFILSLFYSFYIILRGSVAVHAKKVEATNGNPEPVLSDVTVAKTAKERGRFGPELCVLSRCNKTFNFLKLSNSHLILPYSKSIKKCGSSASAEYLNLMSGIFCLLVSLFKTFFSL